MAVEQTVFLVFFGDTGGGVKAKFLKNKNNKHL